jgi:cysteine desulfurase
MRVYLDHNATTPLDPRVRQAIAGALAVTGNPSSVHAEGRRARDAVETARRQVAALLGARIEDIVFTSGGTEADALGVIGLGRLARAAGRPAVALVPAIEHPAVHGAASALASEGFRVDAVAVDENGVIDAGVLASRCAAGAAVLAVSLANHELGTVQDVPALARIARDAGVLVHCDAVQAAGKLAVDVAALGADAVAISAHKIYGPTGAGALWIDARHGIAPLVAAGHQERERRPGTENVPGIVGFGEAARWAAGEGLAAQGRVRELRDALETGVRGIDGARVHGAGATRVANTLNVGFDGALGEVVVAALDLAGFAVSTGAACTSGTVQPSPVLLGVGVGEERAREAVRFSLGVGTTRDEVEAVLEVLPGIVARAREFR